MKPAYVVFSIALLIYSNASFSEEQSAPGKKAEGAEIGKMLEQHELRLDSRRRGGSSSREHNVRRETDSDSSRSDELPREEIAEPPDPIELLHLPDLCALYPDACPQAM